MGGKAVRTSIRAMQTAANLNEWAVVIAECRQSGLCATEWCRQNGIKPNLYFKWQRKVFDALMEQQGTQLQELPTGGVEEADRVQFAELPILAETQRAGSVAEPYQTEGKKAGVMATLRMCGAEIDIYPGADMNVVEALCRVVSHAR